MTRAQKTVFLLVAIIAVLIGMIVYRVLQNQADESPALFDAGVVLLQTSRPLPTQSLVDQDGQTVQVDKLYGGWTAMFFGYTFCPDICPVTLAQLREIRSRLPQAAMQRLRVVFVSVDPGRDTPAKLKQYLAYFDPTFRGLTGTQTAIEALANGVGIAYVAPDTRSPNYFVQHSGNVALLGPDGTLRGFIRAPLSKDKLVAQLPALLMRD